VKFVGTLAECETVRDAWAFAAGFPFAPAGLDAGTAATLRAQWLAASRAERVALAAGPMLGWTFYPHDIEIEAGAPRGTERFVLEVPEEILTVVVPDCSRVYGRTLGAQRTTTLTDARARCTDELPPDWQRKLTSDTRR
jgi:hypothetical protein